MNGFDPSRVKFLTGSEIVSDPKTEIVQASGGTNVHYTVNETTNEATIDGVEINQGAGTEERLTALEDATNVAETLEACGFDVDGIY